MLEEALEKYGLSDKEAKIYLACLELGSATALEIAKKSKITRSTVYSVLDSLMAKTLITEFEQKKIKHYKAEDPQKIINLAKDKHDVIKSVFPELKNLYLSQKSKPQITYYQGKEEIKEMYNDILRMKNLKEYVMIALESEWLTADPQFFTEFKKQRAKLKIKTRMINEDSPIARKGKQQARQTLTEVKLLPKNFPWQPTGGVYIFDNKIILVSYSKDIAAIEIVNKNIAGLLKMNFEFMWSNLSF